MRLFLFLATFYLPLVSAQSTDLTPDPAAITGQLDNGFSYVVRRNAEPPGRVSFRLHIDAGSLHERDDQRGLAHFLEHMVFNGTRSYSADELVPMMQRLGIAFGAHANAYTSFDETVYMLDLPNTKDSTLNLAYTVMRDFADGALLKKEEIDKERGVILAEKNSRDSIGYRMMIKRFEFLLPKSYLIQRIPIGSEDVIKSAPRDAFTDFYRQYYAPKRMTFIAVGDLDPKATEKRIREAFVSLENPTDPGKEPPLDTPITGQGLRTEIFQDPEISSDSVSLSKVTKFTPRPDSRANRLKDFPLDLANIILTRRFQEKAKEENSPILGGSASQSVLFNRLETGDVSVTATKDRWQDAVSLMEQEFRRMKKFGPTEAEIEREQRRLLTASKLAIESKETRDSAGIAMEYVQAINADRVVITPEEGLKLLEEAIAKYSAEDSREAFAKFWDTPDLNLTLTTGKAPDDAKATLENLYLDSKKTEITAPEQKADQEFAYQKIGNSSKVTSKKEVDDLDITQLTFSNNVRVNLKPTDFRKNTINLIMTFGNGLLTLPKEKPGLQSLASAVINAGGLGKHSTEELDRILAGRTVSTGFSIAAGAFHFVGRTTPEDLELQLQLLCANLVDPGYRPEAERQFKSSLPMFYQSLKHSPQGPMIEVSNHLAGNDYRFQVPSEEKAISYTSEDVKSWLAPAFENAPLEISIVGDFDQEKILPLLAKTVGALPTRQTKAKNDSVSRKINRPTRPDDKTYTFESKIPNAFVYVTWPIPGAKGNEKLVRRFNLLSTILSDRLREEIREKLGDSYSPRGGIDPHPELEMGDLTAMAQVKPDVADRTAKLIVEIADKMATEGLTADELDRARKPLQSNLEKSKRDNSYWLNTVLDGSQTDATRLELARNRDADYASITLEELNALAKKHLPKTKSLTFKILPKS